MRIKDRKTGIVDFVNKKEKATVQELAEYCKVSEATIRRDIVSLSREGKLARVHGGAVKIDDTYSGAEAAVLAKGFVNQKEKLCIAEYAASLIMPGDYVFIDAGSTTRYMVPFIKEEKAVYVTNAISLAKDLVRSGMKVFLIGGEIKENSEVIVGSAAILNVQKYHFDKGFFGTNGVDIKLGYTTSDVREALIKRVAIENTLAGERYVLADHDKFGISSAVTFSEFDGTVLITDMEPGKNYNKVVEIEVVSPA